MLIGLGKVKGINGEDISTFSVDGTDTELKNFYSNFEIEHEENDDASLDNNYDPSNEDEYRQFANNCCASIDNMYIDEDNI